MKARDFYDFRAADYDERHQTFRAKHLRHVESATIKKFAFGNVLDIGCGTGEHLSGNIGIDPSLPMLLQARKKGFSNTMQANAEELPFRNESFDTVICMFTVLNMCDYTSAIKEMSRVLKKGGRAVISASSVWDHSTNGLLKRLLTPKRSQILRMRIHKFRFKFFAFSKEDLLRAFSGFSLLNFYGAYLTANTHWGWKRDFELHERLLLKLAFAAERLLQPLNRAARMYIAVFEKRL